MNKDLNIQNRQRRRISTVLVAACALLFISTASVNATASNNSWNGIEIKIGKSGKGVSKPTDKKKEESYRKKLEAALSKSANVWEALPVDKANKQFPYSLLRPKDSKFELVKSFGVVLKDKKYRAKSGDEWWLAGFYDIFQWKQTDIVVKQDLDTLMTETVKDPKKTLSMTFEDAAWEKVEIADNVLALFAAESNENLLKVYYKTADRKVISLELMGDLTKDDLVTLAKTYMGKK